MFTLWILCYFAVLLHITLELGANAQAYYKIQPDRSLFVIDRQGRNEDLAVMIDMAPTYARSEYDSLQLCRKVIGVFRKCINLSIPDRSSNRIINPSNNIALRKLPSGEYQLVFTKRRRRLRTVSLPIRVLDAVQYPKKFPVAIKRLSSSNHNLISEVMSAAFKAHVKSVSKDYVDYIVKLSGQKSIHGHIDLISCAGQTQFKRRYSFSKNGSVNLWNIKKESCYVVEIYVYSSFFRKYMIFSPKLVYRQYLHIHTKYTTHNRAMDGNGKNLIVVIPSGDQFKSGDRAYIYSEPHSPSMNRFDYKKPGEKKVDIEVDVRPKEPEPPVEAPEIPVDRGADNTNGHEKPGDFTATDSPNVSKVNDPPGVASPKPVDEPKPEVANDAPTVSVSAESNTVANKEVVENDSGIDEIPQEKVRDVKEGETVSVADGKNDNVVDLVEPDALKEDAVVKDGALPIVGSPLKEEGEATDGDLPFVLRERQEEGGEGEGDLPSRMREVLIDGEQEEAKEDVTLSFAEGEQEGGNEEVEDIPSIEGEERKEDFAGDISPAVEGQQGDEEKEEDVTDGDLSSGEGETQGKAVDEQGRAGDVTDGGSPSRVERQKGQEGGKEYANVALLPRIEGQQEDQEEEEEDDTDGDLSSRVKGKQEDGEPEEVEVEVDEAYRADTGFLRTEDNTQPAYMSGQADQAGYEADDERRGIERLTSPQSHRSIIGVNHAPAEQRMEERSSGSQETPGQSHQTQEDNGFDVYNAVKDRAADFYKTYTPQSLQDAASGIFNMAKEYAKYRGLI